MAKRMICFAVLLLMLSLCVPALSDSAYQPGDYLGSETIFQMATVVSRNVSLREVPSFDGKLLATAPNGTQMDVLGEQGGWLQVRYFDQKGQHDGWVVRDYVVRNPMTIILRESNVPAYAAPTTESTKVGSLPSYTELTVIGIWDDYYVVSLREASAFIRVDVPHWTDWDMAQYQQSDGMGYSIRTLRKTSLRAGPGTNWAVADSLATGAKLNTLSTIPDNGWYVVRFKDASIAYVNMNDIEFLP